jgi:putative component of membrane protein insertase Oxa1/YidC/SpoIIIJ protein YidD
MDSSLSTSSFVKAEHSKRVGALSGKNSEPGSDNSNASKQKNLVKKYVVEMIFACYRYFFKPALFALSGPYQQCRYDVSCSEYAKRQYLTNSLLKATRNSFRRIVSCNPWTAYKPDPVEESK